MGRPRISTTPLEPFVLRLPRGIIELTKHFAARHGRSASAEARFALELHIHASMLHALDHDAPFVEEVSANRPDFDVDQFREETERLLESLRAQAYPEHPQPHERLAPLLRRNEP